MRERHEFEFDVTNLAWPRSPLNDEGISDDRNLVAIDQYSAIEYRDKNGDIFHRYDLPRPEEYFYTFRHYFRYFGTKFSDLNDQQLKFRFLFHVLVLIRKLSVFRKNISILEIGATLGENYMLLMDAVRAEGLNVEIEYVGIDNDNRTVGLARELHANDPNFWIIHGDGSDLSRFQDNSFDYVISNSVHNILTDHDQGMREAFRVARLAFLTIMLTTVSEHSIIMRYASQNVTSKVFTEFDLKRTLEDFRPYWLYSLSKYWWGEFMKQRSGDGDGTHVDIHAEKTIRWTGWVFAKHRILPELKLIESYVDGDPTQ